MKIVNAHLAHSIKDQGLLKEPNSFGYITIAMEVERPRLFSSNSPAKKGLLSELKAICKELNSSFSSINRADVFDAFIIPPGSKEGRALIEEKNYDVHVAAFDVVILIECKSVSDALAVRESEEIERALELAKSKSAYMDVMVYKNAKRIDEVSKEFNGVFLFNFFYSEDTQTLLDVWEYTAGWWTEKANLTNSTPLQPVEAGSQYNLINHCRWDKLMDVLPSLVIKPSMRNFVLKNFTENSIMAMPILYRLA
ncbi:hypothetical protein MLD52_19150 [Puniceicoccaceae bacterium K14]|nr:hypothetical protein [Puniceicoccaceae bacterium K14]